jgi:hypothetical protein
VHIEGGGEATASSKNDRKPNTKVNQSAEYNSYVQQKEKEMILVS